MPAGSYGKRRELQEEDERRTPRTETESDTYHTASDSEDSEDNIPLAQRIPGALQAQKSIRIKDKAERERKRKERHIAKQKPVRALFCVHPVC